MTKSTHSIQETFTKFCIQNQSTGETFTNIDHIPNHKVSFNKFLRYIILTKFLGYSAIKLEVNDEKTHHTLKKILMYFETKNTQYPIATEEATFSIMSFPRFTKFLSKIYILIPNCLHKLVGIVSFSMPQIKTERGFVRA